MARERRQNTTKREIIQVANKMFLENGYLETSIKSIGEELGISAGHIMFYFPTKEHMLKVLIERLCEYQWKVLRESVENGDSSLMAICLELAVHKIICDENEAMRKLYIAAYTNPLPLEYIRHNDTERSKLLFREYCKDWDDAKFREVEILVSGIEYALFSAEPGVITWNNGIVGAIKSVLVIYNVPPKTQQMLLEQIGQIDCRNISRRICKDFYNYVETADEQMLAE